MPRVVIMIVCTMLALLVVFAILMLVTPLRTREEIEERKAKKLEKRKRSIDVLNVKSKGGG